MEKSKGEVVMPGSSRTVSFATGNSGKVEEATIILAPFGIRVKAFDGKGVEIQAETVEEVASYSAAEAASSFRRALMVEDAGFFVEALNGFPGVYASHAFGTIGIAGVLKLLEGSRSRRAVFRSAVAYCTPGGKPVIFRGEVKGRISEAQLGRGGFGFDPVFVPEGFRKTMAQLTVEQKCAVSHRGEAMRAFGAWYSRL